MNSRQISRIFANAVVRRIAYVLVAAALAWIGMGDAKAACTNATTDVCDQGTAFQLCQTNLAYQQGQANHTIINACTLESGSRYRCSSSWNGGIYGCKNQTLYYFVANQSCSSRPAHIGAPPTSTQSGQVRQGSISCVNGCAATWFNNGDNTWTGSFSSGVACTNETLKQQCAQLGGGRYWNSFLQACEPSEQQCTAEQVKNATTGQCEDACPAGMVVNAQGQCENKNNECPAGEIKAPSGACLPGEGQCAAGEARKPDGTCGKDTDGDGEPDPHGETDPETFSGGDSCDAPPSCSGSVIMCGQARIQWRIDCNTRKNRNISGGSCAAMPVCTGEKCDALEYSSLLMQWRTACALEKQGTGSGTGSGQPDWTKVAGMSQDPGAGSSATDTKVLTEKTLSVSDIDQSGFGGGGSCAGLISSPGQGVGAAFATYIASPPAWFCDGIAMFRVIAILGAGVLCAFMLSKGGLS